MTDSSCVSTLARNEELEGLLREAVAALEPFARTCDDGWGAALEDGVRLWPTKEPTGPVTQGDFRRASSILAKINEAVGEKT